MKLNLSKKIGILAAVAIIVSSVSVGICSINVSKKPLRGLIIISLRFRHGGDKITNLC